MTSTDSGLNLAIFFKWEKQKQKHIIIKMQLKYGRNEYPVKSKQISLGRYIRVPEMEKLKLDKLF